MIHKIDEKKRLMAQAMKAQDARSYASVYDKSGTIFLEGGTIVRGDEAITKQIQGFLDLLGPLDLKLTSIDTWEDEDSIKESGRFAYSYLDQDEPFYKGLYIYIWKKVDGDLFLEKNFSIDD